MERLDHKTALITGAKGGLGTFVTKTFLAAGANVVGVSRSIEASDFPDPRFVAIAAELSSGNAARRVAGSGRMVAIGSRAAVEPQPSIAAYSTSKAALLSLILSVAKENKDRGITANMILPGTMDTPANRAADPKAGFSKWVDPQQAANLALWLASDASAQVSGAAIPVYGGEL
jgi:NAD(P)-dependent dehydrogenase (short-subunit alcohol dehydrogenase family)